MRVALVGGGQDVGADGDHPDDGFTDPLAARLLGHAAEELPRLGTTTATDRLGGAVMDRPRRLFFATRARFAEDTVAVAAGVRQVVILGAGLDTFAYRNPRRDLRVFEVDHPATQAWKRERLATTGIDSPETLTFVPVDFETQTPATELEAAGFSRTDPAVFVWLGVVYYLTPDAAHATLAHIAGQAQPVEVVFDYLRSATTERNVPTSAHVPIGWQPSANPCSATSLSTASPHSCEPSGSPVSRIARLPT